MATKSLTSIPFDKKIKDLVDRQLPQFIRTDHATFVTFIEKYYEWMEQNGYTYDCLLYTSPSPRDATLSRMPSSA